jgi:predicted lipoprotein with Yx(FWY)xxD motif
MGENLRILKQEARRRHILKILKSHIHRPAAVSGLLVILSLVLAACAPAGAAPSGAYGNYGVAAPSSTPRPASTQTALVPVTGATGSAAVQVATDPKLGQILVAANGMTLYTFALDSAGASKCRTDCSAYWPAYVVSAAPSAGAGITGKLGTLTRSDGSLQVTYNGLPLYTYILDNKPGDVIGEGVNDFGGVWHAALAAPAPVSGGPHY